MAEQTFDGGASLLVRTPLHKWAETVVDPGTAEGADPYPLEALVEFLRRERSPLFEEALELSSPALAATIRQVVAGAKVKPGVLRRAALSLTRYQIRAACRSTPFGLLAGAGLLRTGAGTKVDLRAGHRRSAGPDLDWLIAAVRVLEADEAILGRLRVQANNLAVPRGDRLTLPFPMDARGETTQRSVRHTAVVQAVMDRAAAPIQWTELVDGLVESFAGAPRTAVTGLVRQLVQYDLLLTELRPPNDHPDPLGHVLALAPEAAGLPGIADAMEAYSARDVRYPAPEAARELVERMRTGDPGAGAQRSGEYLAVDVALDVDGTVHQQVVDELAEVAGLLWRIAPEPPATPALRAYHVEFLDRYGLDRAVPLVELLDPERGLGAPAGYNFPGSEREVPAPRVDLAREEALAELALSALHDGGELVLDERTVARLTQRAAQDRPPRGLDLIAELSAPDADAVDAGDFRLTLMAWAGGVTPAAAFGRFAHLLGGAEALRAAAGELQTEDGPLAAHLSFGPHHARYRNVARTAHWLPHRIVVGAFGGERPGDIPLSDLAIGADRRRLRLFRRSTGEEVDVYTHYMLNPNGSAPNVARFLQDLARMGTAGWTPWHWGAAENLPALPRVRFGHTIVSPAMWRCSTPELRDEELSWPEWEAAFARWRERWSVPEIVRVGGKDQHLRLDLSRQWHRWLLRAEIASTPDGVTAVLREDPSWGRTAGWLGEGVEVAELVVPMRATAAAPPTMAMRPVSSSPVPFLPGGEWLYAKLYTDTQRHRDLLAGEVARFAAELPPEASEYFFLRYRDPEPHVRVRIHGDAAVLSGVVLGRLHDWAAGLLASGLIRRMDLAGYEPEYERYGGTELMPLAHRVFHADSELVLATLARRVDQTSAEPWLTGAVGAVGIIRGAVEGLGIDPVGWSIAALPGRSEHHHARFRPHSAALVGEAASEVPAMFGDAELTRLWNARAEALREYAEALAPEHRDTALLAVIHMHHNRLIGIDLESEKTMRAGVLGLAQILDGRRRAGR